MIVYYSKILRKMQEGVKIFSLLTKKFCKKQVGKELLLQKLLSHVDYPATAGAVSPKSSAAAK